MSKVSPASSKAAARSSKSSTAAGASSASNAKGKLPVPLLLGGGIFLVVVFVFVYMLFGGSQEPVEQNVEVVVPQSGELDTGADSAPIIPIDDAPNDLLVAETAVVVVDPFESPDLINAVTDEAVTTAIKSDPSYTENVGLLMPDGTMFATNSAEFVALKQEVGGPVHGLVSSLVNTQPTDSGDVWMYNDIDSGQGPIPLASQDAKSKVMALSVKSANDSLQTVKARYTPQQEVVAVQTDPNQQVVQQVQEPVQRIVEVSTINDEERQLLNSIIQELRTQNKNTKDELKAAAAEKRSVEKELVQLRQRVEDNPALKNVVRASMLPRSTGYKLDAVMGDKIFLRNIKTDEISILQAGQNIPNTTYSISSADMDTGIVLVTPSK